MVDMFLECLVEVVMHTVIHPWSFSQRVGPRMASERHGRDVFRHHDTVEPIPVPFEVLHQIAVDGPPVFLSGCTS